MNYQTVTDALSSPTNILLPRKDIHIEAIESLVAMVNQDIDSNPDAAKDLKTALLHKAGAIARVGFIPVAGAVASIIGCEFVQNATELPKLLNELMPTIKAAIGFLGFTLSWKPLFTAARLYGLGKSINS